MLLKGVYAEYFCEPLPTLSEIKLNDGVFVGLDIKKPSRDENFESQIRKRKTGSLLNDFLDKKAYTTYVADLLEN